MKTRGTMDATFFDYFWIMKRREIFFQVHVTNVSYTVEKRKILKTSHRERDPIPPNNLLRKLSHFFHPPKFHTFQYLHYESPKNNPPRRRRDNGQVRIPSPGHDVTTFGPRDRVMAPFSIRVFHPCPTRQNDFSPIPFSFFPHFRRLHRGTPSSTKPPEYVHPFRESISNETVLFFSSFLPFFSFLFFTPDNINSWEKFREF